MIGFISGKLLKKSGNSLIVENGGVGYKIYTTSDTYMKGEGSPLELWTYLAVRENALDLYGFETEEELSVFELLLTVSGIGPKSALATLESTRVQPLRHAVISGDAALLVKTTGIGKKTAEKIVLELKGKIKDDFAGDIKHTHSGSEAIDALVALGYSEKQAREAYDKIDEKDKKTELLIKEALKHIS